MSRWTVAAIAAEAAALGCAIATYMLRDLHLTDLPPLEIEGAYFDRSEGAPAYAGVFDGETGSWFDPFTLSNPYLWLGAAVAFALMGLVLFLLARVRRPAA